MFARRMLYLTAIILAVTFHMVYPKYDSYLVLGALIALPALSLAVSLVSLWKAEIDIAAPRTVCRGERAALSITLSTALPLPHGGATVRVLSHNRLTGDEPYPPRIELHASARTVTAHVPIDTKHCGTVDLALFRVRLLDHLGLFALPIRCKKTVSVQVLPKPVAPDPIPNLFVHAAYDLKPKAGGGFSEEHELRPYRDGDPLVSVHWKLSSKLDALIVREPMVPRSKPITLLFDLAGTPDALDAAFDELLWLSERLISHRLAHIIRYYDHHGRLRTERVSDRASLERILGRMLATPASEEATEQTVTDPLGVSYRVGKAKGVGA